MLRDVLRCLSDLLVMSAIMVSNQLKVKAIQVGVELLDSCYCIKCFLFNCRVVSFHLLQLSAPVHYHSFFAILILAQYSPHS